MSLKIMQNVGILKKKLGPLEVSLGISFGSMGLHSIFDFLKKRKELIIFKKPFERFQKIHFPTSFFV
jgi:hypothetical protein